MMISGSRVNEELLWLYIKRSGEAFDWLMEQAGEAVIPLNISSYGDKWSPDCGLDKAIDEMIEQGRCAWKADTLEELAEKIGVPADNFLKTVARYNELAEKGDDDDFGKRSELSTTIEKPPYYALKWGTALLDVFGGAPSSHSVTADSMGDFTYTTTNVRNEGEGLSEQEMYALRRGTAGIFTR